MDILHSMLGSIQESLKSTEATLTSPHPKTSFNPSKSTLQLLSLTTCEPDVHHGRCYSTTRSTSRVLPFAPSSVPYHSLKSFVLYSLRQLCSTTRKRVWGRPLPSLDLQIVANCAKHYHLLKSFVLYSLRQLCSTTAKRVWGRPLPSPICSSMCPLLEQSTC
jgi:hypothetical protein